MTEKNTQAENPANTPAGRELIDIANKVREWQIARQRGPDGGLSDEKMCRKFDALGSSKTYKKIINGDLDELDVEEWLLKYRTVIAVIEAIGEQKASEELFDDLRPVLDARRIVSEVMREDSIARFVLVEGDTGSGKSSAMRCIQRRYGSRFISVQAQEVWCDQPAELLAAILKALGIDRNEIPWRVGDRMAKVIERLTATRKGVLIDEGHHMGPRCLNTLKAIINDSPSEIIVFAMLTLWRKQERGAYQEAKQLTQNRLFERITLAPLGSGDVKKIVERRLGDLTPEDQATVVTLFMKHAKNNGNGGFIRNVFRRLRNNGDKVQTFENVTKAITSELASRGVNTEQAEQ